MAKAKARKQMKVKPKWIVTGYYYDGKTAWTYLIANDGSGKEKKVKGIL